MAFLDNFLPYLQLPPTIYTITLYTPGHLEISWEVFAKKSADILSFRNSFITISSIIEELLERMFQQVIDVAQQYFILDS